MAHYDVIELGRGKAGTLHCKVLKNRVEVFDDKPSTVDEYLYSVMEAGDTRQYHATSTGESLPVVNYEYVQYEKQLIELFDKGELFTPEYEALNKRLKR